MVDIGNLLALTFLGSWAALDGTAVGQILVSRPFVSAALAGWIVGDPTTGLLVGVILEGAHLGELPIGGARLPEPGPAGVPAAAAAVWAGGAEGLAIGVAIGVVWSVLGGLTVSGQRRLNGVLTKAPEGGWQSPGQLSLRHWSCVFSDGVRGAAVTCAGLALALLLPESFGERWPLGLPSTVGLLVMPGFLSGGALIRTWSAARGARALFALGFIVGAAFTLVGR